MPSTKLAAGQQSGEPGSMANMGGGAERLTEQGWGGLQRECVEGMCVCGSGQGSCLIFSLLLAENAAASCSKGRESVTALAHSPRLMSISGAFLCLSPASQKVACPSCRECGFSSPTSLLYDYLVKTA